MPFGEKKRDKHAGMFGSKERADHDAQVAQDPAPAARAAKSLKLLADLERSGRALGVKAKIGAR